ncbi:MAG: substrate-binding domain-containing protein [Candidatus Lokiarchaeota archaeon]|nr:substrate-binding domain-containing protein [Candidatus Lokiarchaeota archaeon]
MSESGIIKDFIQNNKKSLFLLVIIVTAGLTTTFIILELFRAKNRIILATTTSTNDSGLLDYILPEFIKNTNIEVDVLSVGTGQALEIGQRGDVDVILVHSREREDLFVNNSYGVYRTCVMYNDFIIIGPSTDPAGIMGIDNISTVMNRLKAGGISGNITFYSRGDGSGTHSKELSLWDLINFTPSHSSGWYVETGEGMGTTLTITNQDNENEGYTLVDRGTWLFTKNNLNYLIALSEAIDEILLNPYGVIPINPILHPYVKYEFVLEFIGFLVSQDGQDLINDYTVNGEKLFNASFGSCNETFSCETTEEEISFWSQYNGGYLGGTTSTLNFIYRRFDAL